MEKKQQNTKNPQAPRNQPQKPGQFSQDKTQQQKKTNW